MLDTSEAVRKQQVKIILSKTPQERAMMGVDMIDTAYSMIKNTIIRENPEISQGELIAKIFYRYYRREFLPSESERIMQAIETAHCAIFIIDKK